MNLNNNADKIGKSHRIAFKMQLHKGFKEEYKIRHETLWPELKELLKATAISDYSFFG
jgi:L-rhamnose mutarotase